MSAAAKTHPVGLQLRTETRLHLCWRRGRQGRVQGRWRWPSGVRAQRHVAGGGRGVVGHRLRRARRAWRLRQSSPVLRLDLTGHWEILKLLELIFNSFKNYNKLYTDIYC